MTSEWKSTINNAYTNPVRLHPVLEQTIPSLIKDEVQRLANLVLFQKNVRSTGISSQVPVDMKFTGDSLHIRISKKAPWISLLPSSKLNMSPEEKAVDAVRKEVMERIALLWGGISSDSSNESDFNDRSAFESSTKGMKTTQRIRPKRSRRTERQKRSSGSANQPSTRISRNKIDCSTHTTNNYSCCVGAHNGLSPHSSGQRSKSPTADSNTQTDSIFNPAFRHQNLPKNHKITDFSEDSSSNESEDSSTHSFSSKQERNNRHFDTNEFGDSLSRESKDRFTHSFGKKRQLKSRHSNRMKGTDSFNNESSNNSTVSSPIRSSLDLSSKIAEKSSTGFLDSRTLIREADLMTSSDSDVNESNIDNPIPVFPREQILKSHDELFPSENTIEDITFSDSDKESESSSTRYFTATPDLSSDPDISDVETELPYFTASDEDSDLENSSFIREGKESFSKNTEQMPSLRPIPSKPADPFIEIKKFIETYDTDSKPIGHRRAFIELQVELAQEKPDRAKINNLLLLLQADSLQIIKEEPTHKIRKKSNDSSKATRQESIISQTNRMTRVNPITIDQDIQTDFEIVTKNQYTNTQQLASPEQDSLQLMNHSEELVSAEVTTELNTFVTDSIEQIDVYMDIVNTHRTVNNHTIEVEVDPEIQSLLMQNRAILMNLQNVINSDSLLEKNNNKINSLLDQLDLNTLRLVYDNPDLEIPFIEENFNDASILLGSTLNQLSPLQVNPSMQRDLHQADEDIELLEKLQDLLEKVKRLDNNISLPVKQNPTANATTQSDDSRTDKEIKLQKRLQTLSKKYENLAGVILKQSKKEQKQQADISELRFQLKHTKNELVEALRRFETLAESTEKKFKISEDQSEYIRNLERELEELQQLLLFIPHTKNTKLVSKVMSTQTEKQEDDSIEEIEEGKTTLPLNLAQENEHTEDYFSLATASIKTSSPLQSENEEEELIRLLDQYQELGKDLQTVKKKDDLSTLEEFYNKYANSGIHIQLHVLAEQLRFNQYPLAPSRDMVLKRRQDTLDMLHLFDKTLSEDVWSNDSGNETEESGVLLEPSLFESKNKINDNKNLSQDTPISYNPVLANASTQSEKTNLIDAFTQDETLERTNISTQVGSIPLTNASTQTVQAIREVSTQVNHKSDKELELEDQLDDTSKKFEKLAAFVETEFKSTEDQFESIRELETKVQALEEVNKDLVATINTLKKRKILPAFKEDILETQFIEEKKQETETEIDSSLQVESPHYVFADLPTNIRRLFYLYETVTHDLNELSYSLSTKKFYEKYKKSTVIADLTTFAKRVDQIDPITDITLPTEQEIDNVVQQVRQVFLQEKELEEAELAEFEEDFDRRLKKYNELTSDLQKFQNKQLTLAELYNKYANTNVIRELEIFARQERDQSPSRVSVENKIKNLRELLLTFDNDLNTIEG